jgi:CheY-like chemotaxis protein
MIKALNILLIEDDEIEVMKFNRVLSNLKQLIRLLRQIMEEAIAILKEKEIIPDIIVLDLNMPK